MIRLTDNKVAIQAVFDPDRTEGGIWIPDVAKERCDQGIVKYIGPKVKDLRVGDYVLFGGYDGTSIRLEGEGVLIMMRETAVKCIIEHNPIIVEGLFFQGKPSKSLSEILIREGITAGPQIGSIMTAFGEYLSDVYFPATSESAISLISQAYKDHAITYKNHYTERESPVEVYDDS